jgi:hypothetical protein
MQMLLRHAIPGTRDLQLIIELTDPSVAQTMTTPAPGRSTPRAGLAQGRAKLQLDTPQAVTYRAQLARGQRLVTDRLSALSGVQIQGSTDLVMNSIIARVPVEHYLAVRRMPGVKKVYFSRPQRMNLNAAASLHNAPALWAHVAGGRANAGQGQRIGLIDTGIDITNSMFVDTTTPLPAGFPKYDSTADRAFTNHKVIVARNYVALLSNADRDYTARDDVGHGTFVAGCAAGKLVTAPLAQISGMAPGAFLGSYKVFGYPGYNDTTTTAAILAAINDAVIDGMDVLNLSLGSLDYVPPSEDPEVGAISNAVAAGLVVCLAAGNEGPDTHSINSPGGAPDAISVGAIFDSRVFSAQLHVAGTGVPANLQSVAYTNGTGPAISTAINASAVKDVAALDGTGLACSALPALSGQIAFIERGTCTFLTKVTNAANAGARAVVVYDNVPGDSSNVAGESAIPIHMGGLSTTHIPAVMIFNADGLALKSYLATNPSATISIGTSTSNQLATPTTPVLSSDSSRGPSADFGIKPDLVAVGWNVYSAAIKSSSGLIYDPTGFYSLLGSGTSFSTPMVSGAAAAVMQLFPGLTPGGVKSALANTASQITIDGVTPATVVQAGNGLLNMGNASAAGAIFSPTNLNFGAQAYSDSISLTQTLGITNVSGSPDQFTISVQPIIDGASISLSTANTGTVAPGASTSVDVTMQAVAPLTGGFQGFLTVQSSVTSATYAIPYWAGLYVPDPTTILTVSQSSTGPGIYSNLTAALAAANPGNIIEIADSQTYTMPVPDDASLSSITISTNAQGLPLHGITIRAAAGQTPVLDGTTSGANAYADLQIVGLQNVLLQGLTINGGETGVDIWQPSPSVPLSVTIDHCNITNQRSSTTSDAVYVENGGDVDITYSTISGSVSTGIVLGNGGQLTMSNSTVQGNGSDGIDAVDANVQLLNSTIISNIGQGAYLSGCSGTVIGNTFSNTLGSYGDGLLVEDGALSVNGNTFSSNAGAGVSLYANVTTGPKASLSRNTIQSNVWGLWVDAAQNLKLDGNLIEDNGQGLQVNSAQSALLTNDIVVRSTNATTGDGITVADSSVVRIVNSTFYNNRHRGITLNPGAAISVANSIISSNVAGDLSGLSTGSIQFSLIGNGTLASGFNNISGNPSFTNPAGNDFSLSPGSRAIDAGSNAAANLPFLDYNQQFRVASSGSLPGDGVVDMGAIESGSSFPLVFPLMVNGYNSTIGDNYTTGIAVVNASTSPVSAGFAAYGPDGTLLSGAANPSAPMPLAAGAEVPILGYQLFGLTNGAGQVGGILAGAAQQLTGFFLVFDNLFQRVIDGVDVSATAASQFFFTRHEFDAAGQATYAIFNPGVNAATVNATLFDVTGTQIDQLTQPIVLQPKGQSLFTFANFTASSGMVGINSDRPITGLEIFGNSAEISALRAAVPGTDAKLFFPHIVVNQGYSSILGVVNTAAVQANITLTAYANDGSFLAPPVQATVQPNGQLFAPASSLFGLGSGDIMTGYVIVVSDQPGITGFCAFSYDNGVVHSSAAVPCENVPRQKLIFSDLAHQVPAAAGGVYLTGIALLNPFGTQIHYTMKVFDSTGAEVAEMTDVLAPHAKASKLLSHPRAGDGYFTQSIVQSGGHIEVTSDYQLVGFEIFFTDSISQLAAVMAQYPN